MYSNCTRIQLDDSTCRGHRCGYTVIEIKLVETFGDLLIAIDTTRE